jgi:O-antigen ligase
MSLYFKYTYIVVCFICLLSVLCFEKAYNAAYFSLTLFSILLLFFKEKKEVLFTKEILTALALISFYTLPFAINVLAVGSPLSVLEKPLTLFALLPPLIVAKDLKLSSRLLQWVLLASMVILCLVLNSQNAFDITVRRLTLGDINPVAFGYALTAFFSLQLATKTENLLDLFFKLSSLSISLGLVVLTGTRMAFVACTLILILYVMISFQFKKKMVLLALASCVLSFVVVKSSTFQERYRATVFAFEEAQKGNFETSLGYRFEMWRAAAIIGFNNPILGGGEDGHVKYRDQLIRSGRVSPRIAQFRQYHSAALDAFAKRGVPGALSVLFIIFAPLIIFYRKLYKEKKDLKRTSTIAGALLFSAIFLCSLTDGFFDSNYVVRIYAVCFLISMCICDFPLVGDAKLDNDGIVI